MSDRAFRLGFLAVGAVDGPLVVLADAHGAEQADCGVVAGEDADHVRMARHLLRRTSRKRATELPDGANEGSRLA